MCITYCTYVFNYRNEISIILILIQNGNNAIWLQLNAII